MFTRPSHHHRGGFASLTAIALIAIVGLGLAAMASLFAGETRRAVRLRDEAQLRQLLLAGEVAARDALARGERRRAVELPPELASLGTTLTFEPADGGGARARDAREARLRVTARSGEGRVVSQTLTYTGSGPAWTLHSAELE